MSSPTITPETPEITINNTAAEIRAAMDAQTVQTEPAAQQAQQTPAYEVRTGDDGVQIHLETGEVYKGKDQAEAWSRLAESKVHQSKYIRDLNEFRKTYEAYRNGSEAPPQVPPAFNEPSFEPEITPEQERALSQQFFRDSITPDIAKDLGTQALSQVLGVAPEALSEEINNIISVNRNFQIQTTYLDFARECPDYADNAQNNAAIFEGLQARGVFDRAGNPVRLPTVDDLRTSWALARYTGKGTPYTPPQQIQPPPMPPVMPSGGSPGVSEQNPWTMDKAELRKLVR